MEFEDKSLICRDCGSGFIFTAGEQGYYLEKGLFNQPQRCQGCRANRRRERSSSEPAPVPMRRSSSITCAWCGRAATVPFVPRLDRPVYCNDCFGKERASAVRQAAGVQ